MLINRVNNLFVMFIILCSTSFYNLKMLGSGQKAVELLGIGLIIALFILHLVYGKHIGIKLNFNTSIILILLSFFTSSFMANLTREQTFSQSLYAERALLFYLFYLLLHHMRIRVRDLERIFIIFGFIYVVLYLMQFFLYPKIIFDVFIFEDRGTVRVYLPGSDYIAISIFYFAQKFFTTNNLKYLILVFLLYSMFILLGGRQTMILIAFCLLLFLLFSRKVKSRVGLTIIIGIAVTLVFFLFKDIIGQMILTSQANLGEGKEYIRVRAGIFFLTDFFLSPWAYITGNGVPGNNTNYGKEIMTYAANGLYLGDLGTIGHYVMYGPLFIIGVLGICIRVLVSKYELMFNYIKYIFIGITFSLITGPGFGNSDFIVFLSCTLYMIDVSINKVDEERKKIKEHLKII